MTKSRARGAAWALFAAGGACLVGSVWMLAGLAWALFMASGLLFLAAALAMEAAP